MRKSEALELVRAEIDNPRNWCQGRLFAGPVAERVCALGAFRKVAAKHDGLTSALRGGERLLNKLALAKLAAGSPVLEAALSKETLNCVGSPIARYNDTHGHAEVIALFQEAIRAAKHREALDGGIVDYIEDLFRHRPVRIDRETALVDELMSSRGPTTTIEVTT